MNPAPDALAALAELVACMEADAPRTCDIREGYRWHDAWVAARAALLRDQGEVAALREALRRLAIFDQRQYSVRSTKSGAGFQCVLCGETWWPDQPERHTPDCLAQLEPPEGK